jgi:hypothetical protein
VRNYTIKSRGENNKQKKKEGREKEVNEGRKKEK